jgi:hypothetical protein
MSGLLLRIPKVITELQLHLLHVTVICGLLCLWVIAPVEMAGKH